MGKGKCGCCNDGRRNDFESDAFNIIVDYFAGETKEENDSAMKKIDDFIIKAESGAFNGRDGKDGVDGAPGRDGKDGVDGAPGRDGKDGVDGNDGDSGIQIEGSLVISQHTGNRDTAVMSEKAVTIELQKITGNGEEANVISGKYLAIDQGAVVLKNSELCACTDFLSVGGSQDLEWTPVKTNGETGMHIYLIEYDEGKNVIDSWSNNREQGYEISVRHFVTNERTRYLRASFFISEFENSGIKVNGEEFFNPTLGKEGSGAGIIPSLAERVKRLENGAVSNGIVWMNDPISTALKLGQIGFKERNPQNGNVVSESLVLCWFSDIHGSSVNLKRIMEYNEAYRESIDDIVCTGDMVKNYYTESYDWWSATGASKVLTVIGNHETYNTSYQKGYTESQVNQKFIAPFVSSWNVTNPNGKNYWYKDYPAKKIRLIGLDYMYWDDAQNTWLQNALNTAKTSGLSVVIATHATAGNMNYYESSWRSYGMDLERNGEWFTPAAASQSVEKFIASGGEFICWICGHAHYDLIGTLTDRSQICIVMGSSHEGYQNYYDTNMYREVGSKSQDMFNVIGFDTKSKTIRIMRVGADMDKYMRHIDTICINYASRSVVSES